MKSLITKSQKLYEKNFQLLGFDCQRRYPNEELCRFFGRNFFFKKKIERKKIKILETGCGSSGNLWMISKEGFSAYGIDFSKEAISLSKKLFKREKLIGKFTVGDFCSMKYQSNFFDCVVDIFSSCTLDKKNGLRYVNEVNRILKKGGVFFTYFPSKKSNMFNFKSRTLYDNDTLLSLKQNSAYKLNHPIRFMKLKQYCSLLIQNGFKIKYREEVMRTYFSGKEKFFFLVIEVVKI